MTTIKYALDAGYPWGLRISPFTYLPRECCTTMKPELYDTYEEASAAALAIHKENRGRRYHRVVEFP